MSARIDPPRPWGIASSVLFTHHRKVKGDSFMKITVETLVNAPVAKVWSAYTTPADIMKWNTASDDWHTTKSSVDLREGGVFSSRMEAKDGSFGFDFAYEDNRRSCRRS